MKKSNFSPNITVNGVGLDPEDIAFIDQTMVDAILKKAWQGPGSMMHTMVKNLTLNVIYPPEDKTPEKCVVKAFWSPTDALNLDFYAVQILSEGKLLDTVLVKGTTQVKFAVVPGLKYQVSVVMVDTKGNKSEANVQSIVTHAEDKDSDYSRMVQGVSYTLSPGENGACKVVVVLDPKAHASVFEHKVRIRFLYGDPFGNGSPMMAYEKVSSWVYVSDYKPDAYGMVSLRFAGNLSELKSFRVEVHRANTTVTGPDIEVIRD